MTTTHTHDTLATTMRARAARYVGAPCTTCINAAHHLIAAAFSACDDDAHITIGSPYCDCTMCNICGHDLNLCNAHS